MARRVHQLAKELGVKSTAIVSKCQAEGLDIKNHMSTLSAGLEATIREWFSEGEHATTVETTAPVDLEKVKEKKARKKKKAPEPAVAVAQAKEGDEELTGEAAAAAQEGEAAAVLEAPAEGESQEGRVQVEAVETEVAPADEEGLLARAARPHRVSPKELAETETQTQQEEPGLAPAAEAPAAEAPVEVEGEVAAAQAGTAEAAPAAQEEQAAEEESQQVRMAPGFMPLRPKEEAPTAETSQELKHVPKPAQLQGPSVVRVERPEPLSRPRPRPAARGPAAPAGPEIADAAGGKKTAKKARSRSVDDLAEEKGKKKAPRGRRRRGGRGYETGTGLEPHEWGDQDWKERQARLAQAGTGQIMGKARRMADEQPRTAQSRGPQRIEKALVKEPITVKELSAAMGVRANMIIGKLMQIGTMAGVNQTLDTETAQMVALEFGVELEVQEKRLLLDELRDEFDKLTSEAELSDRPPVTAFLGHVDHGKTSLLDRIRKASVASGEAGGITQHIGSYIYDDGKRRVTFLDTPGHAAFTAMRARGANMTDIVVLVVAADDGVMPQTVEAISHARAAEVPIVVAVNKIDLPGVDRNRVLGELSEHGLVPTEWGGDTEVVFTSATTGEGIEDLVEHLDFVAELRQLKARVEGPAAGWVIEAELSTGQGALATVLVSHGTLRPGDVVVSGSTYGRVRTVADAMRRTLEKAGPSAPVEITGLSEVPEAGDRFFVVPDISQAAQIADEQASSKREKTLAQRRQVTLENLFSEIAAGQVKELNVIIKADVQGSVDALRDVVVKLNTEEVAVRVLHAATGGVSESDVLLAEASEAIIIGFQVVADDHARHLAEARGVQIRTYRVIYDVIDDIHQALEGMLSPTMREEQVARVEVRQTFKVSRIGTIAGCYVTEGTVTRSSKLRLIRDGVVLQEGMSLQSLKRGKDDISESRAGFECGIKLANFDDVKVGDILEAYKVVEETRTLETARETRQ